MDSGGSMIAGGTISLGFEILPEEPEVVIHIETCYGREVTLLGWWKWDFDTDLGITVGNFDQDLPHNCKILGVESFVAGEGWM